MATFHWILHAILLSSILHRGNAQPLPQPAQPLLQLQNFHGSETSTGLSHLDGMSIERRDSAAGFFGITADNNKAPRQHHQHVLSQSKNSAEIIRYQEAPPSMEMDKSESQSPPWSATERERWRQVQPSSFPNSFSSPNPYARSNPTPFVYPSPYPNPSRSAYPSPSLNPSRLAYPPPFQNPSTYPSTVSYPSRSFAPAFENIRVSLSPLPLHQNILIPLHSQPSSPSPNWMSEEMQTATVVTGDNRGDSSKDLMAKLWTFGTVTPITPVNHSDVTTKMYQMIFDEHGNMHMNSAVCRSGVLG